MEKKKIMLWDKAPYVDYTTNGLEPSITEYKVNDNKTAVIVSDNKDWQIVCIVQNFYHIDIIIYCIGKYID